MYGPEFVKGRVSHAIAPSLINTDALDRRTRRKRRRYGFNPRGQHVRRQVGEIAGRGRGRYHTHVGIPAFNALPSSLNQLDATSTPSPLSRVNQGASRN